MAEFITILKEIRGTTFDVNGVPTNGMWFDVKASHAAVMLLEGSTVSAAAAAVISKDAAAGSAAASGDWAAAAVISKDAAAAAASAAVISKDAAASAAVTATAKSNEIKGITIASVSTGIAGSAATVSYNPLDGKFYFTIPQGTKGEKGDSFAVNSMGLFAQRALYDAQIGGFSFLALDTSMIYFKLSSTSGDWSLGSSFGKGDTGAQGEQGYGWLHGAGIPDNAAGRDNDFYMNMANADVYIKVAGTWSYFVNLAAPIDDTTVSALTTWSSEKVTAALTFKADKTIVDALIASTVGVPNLGAATATAISSTNMTLNSSVISFGATDKEALSIGFEYRVVGETLWSATAMTAKDILGNFSQNISGLTIVTNYEFRAKALDALNPSLLAYSDVATATTTSNAIPTNPTNTGTFAAQLARGSVTNFTFSGATDSDGTITHYLVDTISSANLTVTTAEVAAGSTHTFNVSGTLSADEVVTFSVKAKDNAGSYSAGATVSVTLKNVFIVTPTLTVTGTPTDVPETPTLTTSAFSVSGGTDTHASTDWQVVRVSDSVVVWESLANSANKLSIAVPAAELAVSTAYTFRARHNGTTYGSSAWVEVAGTTKSAFTIPIGVAGALDFGVAPSSEAFALIGLAEMTGTNTSGHDNYGNYVHADSSIVVHVPKFYYRVGNAAAPQYATYGLNSLEIKGTETFTTEAAANAAGYALHRAFIDGGVEKGGFFFDKYLCSKLSTNTLKAVSVKNGNPIGLTTSTTYTTPSSTMTGCTGILADAVTLSRARGAGWNNTSVFMVGAIAMLSLAHAQRSSTTTYCAWYNATYNFPKGCNNNARADINDTSVTWTANGVNALCGLTGSASTFAKSTHNGQNSGIADVNGLMYQVALGMTNYGTSATDSVAIATNTLYVLKKTSFLKDLTAGWDAVTDAWGNTTNLATRYDAVTSPITISAAAAAYWGSGANQVLSPDASGVAHDLCGFLPKNDAACDATGTSQFGNDMVYKYNRANMYPYTAGSWGDSALAGVFYRGLLSGRSGDGDATGFRAAAYVS